MKKKSSFKTVGDLVAALSAAPKTAVQLDCGTDCDQTVQVAYDSVARMLYILTIQVAHSGAFEWAEVRAEGRRVVAEDGGGGWRLPLEASNW